jgi:hypothetical protein
VIVNWRAARAIVGDPKANYLGLAMMSSQFSADRNCVGSDAKGWVKSIAITITEPSTH